MTFTLQIIITLATALIAHFAAGFIMAITRPPPADKLCISSAVGVCAVVTAGIATGLPPLVIVGWMLADGVFLALKLRRL